MTYRQATLVTIHFHLLLKLLERFASHHMTSCFASLHVIIIIIVIELMSPSYDISYLEALVLCH